MTVTEDTLNPTFPLVSEAVQLTLVKPTVKFEPLSGLQVVVRDPSTRSVAVAVNVAGVVGPVASTATGSGVMVTVGPVLSVYAQKRTHDDAQVCLELYAQATIGTWVVTYAHELQHSRPHPTCMHQLKDGESVPGSHLEH